MIIKVIRTTVRTFEMATKILLRKNSLALLWTDLMEENSFSLWGLKTKHWFTTIRSNRGRE